MKYVTRPFCCFKFDASLKDGILFKTLHNAVCVYLYGSVSTFRYDNLFQVCDTVYGVRRLTDLMCLPCIIVQRYSEINVMYFSFNLLGIKDRYMFRALLAHPQEALHKLHKIYRV
jgi:hypothetical protein